MNNSSVMNILAEEPTRTLGLEEVRELVEGLIKTGNMSNEEAGKIVRSRAQLYLNFAD